MLTITETLRTTEVCGNRDYLYTMTKLYTKLALTPGWTLICQMVGNQSHEVIFAEFIRQNNEE